MKTVKLDDEQQMLISMAMSNLAKRMPTIQLKIMDCLEHIQSTPDDEQGVSDE